MKIAANVEMLEVKAAMGTIYPVLVKGEGELVLIDSGMPGETENLREAVEAAGYRLEDITGVLLTHQDLDHIGGAKALSDLGSKIYAHEVEAPYIQGDVTSVRLSDMEARRGELTADELAFYERAKAGAPHFYARVDHKVKDGELLELCGGIKILHTPGHMPGHMAVLLLESNILVAGDAANVDNGKLVGANPVHTREKEEAAASFRKILDAKADAVVCYHGGIVNLL